jgi:hypothetical protein
MEVWCQYCNVSEVNTKFLNGPPPPHTGYRFCPNIKTEVTKVKDHIQGVRTNYLNLLELLHAPHKTAVYAEVIYVSYFQIFRWQDVLIKHILPSTRLLIWMHERKQNYMYKFS